MVGLFRRILGGSDKTDGPRETMPTEPTAPSLEALGEQRMGFLLGLRRRGIGSADVLRAMDEVPRESFVATGFTEAAYADQALPIACGQTISQPYVVAYMTEQLDVRPGQR